MRGRVDEHGGVGTDLRLFASKTGWIAGLLSLLVALSAVGWIAFGVSAALWPGRRADSRGLLLTGVALSTPMAVHVTRLFGDAGRRLLGPRRGRIELRHDRLVIHDRWMLRRPLEIYRSELVSIERLPRLRLHQYTAFAGRAGQALGARGQLLDWGTRPNAALTLREPRHFVEAIRTLPGRTPLTPISTEAISDCLLVRFAHPDRAFGRLDRWMAAARRTTPPRRAWQRDPWAGRVRGVALWGGGFVGFAVTCLGLALGAPS